MSLAAEHRLETSPVRLNDIDQDFWANHILWALATALGYQPDGEGRISADADFVLDEAVDVINAYWETL